MTNCSTENISSLNPDNICRTCMSQNNLQAFYTKCSCTAEEKCIVELLTKCTFIQYTENDDLPKKICSECVNEMELTYTFIKKVENSYKVLRDYFEKGLTDNLPEHLASSLELKIFIKNEDSDIECDIKSEDDGFNYESDSEDSSDLKLTKKRGRRRTIKKTKKAVTKSKRGPPFECKKCFTSYPTLQELREHWQKVQHPKYGYSRKVCKICNKSVGYSKMNVHMRVHTLEKPYCCENCGASFSTLGSMKRHKLAKHSDEKPFKCDMCEKSFTRSDFLKNHVRTHTGEKPYVCNVCGKCFSQSSSLNGHQLTHENKDQDSGKIKKKEHQCEICQKMFTTKLILKQHQLIHGEKKFLCSFCGKGFVKLIALQGHQAVHTGVKPYSCKVCQKTFSRYQALYSHRRTHTGEKPYACKLCNRPFSQWSHMKRHMLTHTGERPYPCSVCGKSFAQNENLTVHMRTHTGETPYICSVCGKGFYDSSSMKKHKKGHGNLNEEEHV